MDYCSFRFKMIFIHYKIKKPDKGAPARLASYGLSVWGRTLRRSKNNVIKNFSNYNLHPFTIDRYKLFNQYHLVHRFEFTGFYTIKIHSAA
jgi:hypothetical protein